MAGYNLQRVQLRTGTQDQDARLIFIDGELAAVIVLLTEPAHDNERGMWSMEADFRNFGFGHPLFKSPYEAVSWLLQRDSERTASGGP